MTTASPSAADQDSAPVADADGLGSFEALAWRRRTSLLVDQAAPVSDELVARLCRLATWAPNHKRTWPWRFAVLRGDARLQFGAACASDQLAAGLTDEARLTKTRTKYGRAPVIVVVGSDDADAEEQTGENRDAVAAGIQNMLLGATAAGLASFWSSPPTRRGEHALSLLGFPPATQLVGVLYLGWPNGSVAVPARPDPAVTVLT
jgi:nitroreductase